MTVSFNKSRKRWVYDFELDLVRHSKYCLDQTGQPVTCRTAAEASEAEAKRLLTIASKVPRSAELTVAEILIQLSEIWKRKSNWDNQRRYVREVLAYFKGETQIRDIDGAKVQDYVSFAQQQPLQVWKGGSKRKRTDESADKFWAPHPKGKTRSTSTVNRYLPVVRAMFQRAFNTRNPLTGVRCIDEVPKVVDLKEPKRKARPVPEHVLIELFDLLPAHTIDALKVTLHFGFRKTEAFSLTIGHVDFAARGIRLEAGEVKDEEDAFQHGSPEAMELLQHLVAQARSRRTRYLITWQGTRKPHKAKPWRPMKGSRTAWSNAMKKIEKTHGKRWRWHDVRAAYITHVAMTSGPIAAQKLARHSDYSTTQAYIEVADEVMRGAAELASQRPALTAVKGGRN